MRLIWIWLLIVMGSACGSEDGVAAAPRGWDDMGTQTAPDVRPADVGHGLSLPEFGPERPVPCSEVTTARCAERDPDFGTAYVVTALELVPDSTCCADLTADGNADNTFGETLEGMRWLHAANANVAARIDRGETVIVLEVANDLESTVQWWDGVWGPGVIELDPAGPNPVLLSPASIDAGSSSQFQVLSAAIDSSQIRGAGGRVVLPLVFLDMPMQLPVHVAEFRLDLRLSEGEMQTVIEVPDFWTAVNDAAADCDCLGLDAPMIDMQSGTCATPPAESCLETEEARCREFARSCSLFTAAPLFADLQLPNGTWAMSAAFSIATAPAEILGFAPPTLGE